MYENLYPKNPKTGNRMIEISLDDYKDFFHEWDNSTFKKRDMHPELTEFLDQCAEDIPMRDKIEIIFCIENENKYEYKENTLKESYYNYYTLKFRIEKRKIKDLYKSIFILIMIGFGFMFTNLILVDRLQQSVFSEVLLEGLTIGAWVFLWEALHLIGFEQRDLFEKKKELNRLLKTPLYFKYDKSPSKAN